MVIFHKIVQTPVRSARGDLGGGGFLPRCFVFESLHQQPLEMSKQFRGIRQFVARKLRPISEIMENDSAAFQLRACERAAFVAEANDNTRRR